MENKTSKYFKYAIGEIFLVVIGILIALAINNWNEIYKLDKTKIQILQSLENEINANKKHIQVVFNYHKMIRDSLKHVDRSNLASSNQKFLSFWQGHRIFRLRNSSFQTAIQSGIMKELDLNLSESLNNLYTSIQFYNDYGQTVNQGIYAINRTTQEGMMQMLNIISMVMEDVYYAESELLNGFDENLVKIEAELISK